jgi:hypothetical protein
VVTALHYNKEDKQFVAKVQYKDGTDVKSEKSEYQMTGLLTHLGRRLPKSLWIAGTIKNS